MAKIHSYGSARTAPAEVYEITSAANVGDLAVVANGALTIVADATATKPNYLVVTTKKATTNAEPVYAVAITDDMVLYNSTAIKDFVKVDDKLYRK